MIGFAEARGGERTTDPDGSASSCSPISKSSPYPVSASSSSPISASSSTLISTSSPSPMSGAMGEGWGGGWLLLPDLLIFLLGGEPGYERSIASTTQLTDDNGNWNPTVFEKFDLPIPSLPVTNPGIAGEAGGVKLLRVGGHDTACAVEGMGLTSQDEGTVFANIGTWALVGAVRAIADHSPHSESQNWTNERTPWNEVRYLTNIPGFFILNRLHEDLGISESMADWIEEIDRTETRRLDPFAPGLFAPVSMAGAVAEHLGCSGLSSREFCSIALLSLVDTIAERVQTLRGRRLLLGGGASNSVLLRNLIQSTAKVELIPSEAEATILGNLRTQFRILSS